MSTDQEVKAFIAHFHAAALADSSDYAANIRKGLEAAKAVSPSPKHAIEGRVFFRRSRDLPSHGDRKCKCCPNGDHVFTRGVAWEPWDTGFPEHFGKGEDVLVSKVIRAAETEGKRIRVTVEVLED